MKNLICFVFTLCLLFAQKGFSQPKLIKDINTQTADALNLYEGFVGNFGNYFFFKASSGLSEPKLHYDIDPDLWVTDGTTNGTVKVGSGSLIKAPYILSQLGSKVIFYGNDDAHGSELWISDGTMAGTHLLKDIVTGRESSMTANSYSEFVILNDKAYFNVTDDTGKLNIWRTDGTEAGTELFQAIGVSSIPVGTNARYVSTLKVLGNSLYYLLTFIRSSGSEQQLWKTDGTTTGTVMVKSIILPNNSYAFNLTATNNTLFFMIAQNGNQLWATDGTSSGTIMLLSYQPSWLFQLPIIGSINDKILFNGTSGSRSGLWSSDGTVAGTQLLKSTDPNLIGEGIKYNDKLYFWAADSTRKTHLWSSDGTQSNTKVAITTFSNLNLTPFQSRLRFVANNFLFLMAYEGSDVRLFKTDGTDNVLEIIKDKDNNNLSFNSSQNPSLWATPNKLYFSYTDSVHGKELWATDGNSANTSLLKDINQSTNNSIPYGSYRSTVLNNQLYFSAQDNILGKNELWTSGGTTPNTFKVKDRLPNLLREFPQFTGKSETLISTMGGRVYFSGIDTLRGEELWISDGSNRGTMLVKDINIGINSSSPSNPIILGNKLIFDANDGIHGREMWIASSIQPTYMLRDFFLNNNNPNSTYSSIQSKTILNQKLYFIARDNLVNANLWEFDGFGSLNKLTDRFSYSQIGMPVTGLVSHKNNLYYVATSNTSPLSLWASNGIRGGDRLIKDLYIDTAPNGKPIVSFKDWVFVFASDNLGTPSQKGLWKSDGTTVGTTLLLNDERIDNQTFTVANDNLFFTIQNELWKTDGTVKGTLKVTSMGSNLEYNYVQNMNFINGHLYFQVINQIKGIELWQSDGTSEGTMFVLNMSAGHYQNTFNETNKFSVDGTRFFFTGNDILHGRELWTYNTCDNLTNVQSVQSGTWDNAATWTCGHIPKVTDIATILNGNTVEVLQDTYLKRLKLLDGNVFLNGGKLIFR